MNESSSPAPVPVSPLWTRDFTIITLGSVISMLGNSMSGFALSLLVLDYTGSNLLYAIYIATFTLPQIVMPIFSGAILDRFSRKKTIYTLDFLSSGVYLVAALILSRGWFSFPMLAFFCFIIGSINSIYFVAYDSFYPLLISEGNYSKAYSIASVLETLSALIIPIATYFYNLFGIAPLLGINALCFFIAATAETQIRAEEHYIEKQRAALALEEQHSSARQLLREAERQGQKEKLLRAVRFSNRLQSVFPRLGARLARRVLFRRVREQALGTEPMFCISGGGFLQPQAAELMNGLGYGMHNGYGMTETGILSVELSRRAKWRLSGGVGEPLQALSGGWRIADDGVLELRSPLLYTAMLENGVRVPRDPEAWFRTRDVFRAEGGRWYMEARQGDLIIGANGENLSPDLIEQRLALQAGTASCVLGMELEGDERPVLIVQTAADDYARARASAAAYEAVARLPLTMRPARIFLTEQELPISFGKPRRAELREKLADGSIVLTPAHRPEPEELTRLEDESSRALVQELCELLGSVTGQTVGPDTQLLQELGVDSLTYYNIFSAVSERYGISLTMDAAHPLFTARDFAAAVQAEREAVE